MAAQTPLTGAILVDCAKANAKQGAAIAARQCGYGDDIAAFRAALRSACAEMGISITDLSDLITDNPQSWPPQSGIEVAPDTPSDL